MSRARAKAPAARRGPAPVFAALGDETRLTLVEFMLEAKGSGTLLVLRESGFDAIPQHRRFDAFRMNERGWTEQMKNIERHVTPAS